MPVRRLTIAALAFVAALGCRGERPRSAIIICIDTLRTDRLEQFGSTRSTSPFLGLLSRLGTSFSNAQSNSNWTVPAVTSILTGLEPARHGAVLPGAVKHLGVAPKFPNQPSLDVETLPESLSRAGFETALFSGNPYLYGRFRSGFGTAEVAFGTGRDALPRIFAWLGDRGEKPFFLYWQIMDLHHPLRPPAVYEKLFVPKPPPDYPSPSHRQWAYPDLTAEVARSEEFRRFRELKLALYDGTLRHVDDLLRAFYLELRRLGLDESTLLVVTADHGEEFWDRALAPEGNSGDPRGFRGVGHGHTMFQELLHVPMVWTGPGVGSGSVDCPSASLDIHPTLLAALGLPPAAKSDGLDLGPWLRRSSRRCTNRTLVAEAPAYGPESWSIRTGRWKLIRHGNSTLLFDLATDAGELRSLVAEHPGLVRSLTRELEQRGTDARGTAAGETTDALDEELRALGYLQ